MNCCATFRMYALRKIKDAFRHNRNINDAEKIVELYNYGLKNLEIIKRQVNTRPKRPKYTIKAKP